mgnify:CR=1 FL=1
MRVMLISASPINMQTSIGNTFLNILAELDDIELFSIYTRSGSPDFGYIREALVVSEIGLVKSIINRDYTANKITKVDIDSADDRIKNSKLEGFAKKHSSDTLRIVKNIVWKFTPWKKCGIKEFIKEVDPDIIFTLFCSDTEVNDLILYTKMNSDAKLVLYAWDDHYSWCKFSVNPVLWISKLLSRRKMRKVFKLSSKMYVISDLQKQDYEIEFKKPLTVLTKGAVFEKDTKINHNINPVLQLRYTGNIGNGRWTTLAIIVDALKKINKNEIKAQLQIYSATPITKKIRQALECDSISSFMGNVSSDKIPYIQSEADILIHIESFKKREKRLVRQSFSTKIVDYLAMAKCIFAAGPADVASIDYLIKNDAAVVATSKNEIENKLRMLTEHHEMIARYGEKAWECGERDYRIQDIQNMLYNDFEKIVNDAYGRS